MSEFGGRRRRREGGDASSNVMTHFSLSSASARSRSSIPIVSLLDAPFLPPAVWRAGVEADVREEVSSGVEDEGTRSQGSPALVFFFFFFLFDF